MRCAKCGTENVVGKKFCSQCGSGLASRCPKCGAENTPASRFCGDCGVVLTSPAPAGPSAGANRERSSVRSETQDARVRVQPPTDSPIDGERKTVTALFADIKGSMELMEDL